MTFKRRIIIGWAALPIGLALLASGMLIEHTSQWRLQLFVGLWLLSLLPRALLQQHAPGTTRSMRNVMLVCILAFLAVALQLGREQIGQAATTRERVAALYQPAAEEEDQAPAAPAVRLADRTSLGYSYTWPVTLTTPVRGEIFDRGGILLATNRDGRRVYPVAGMGHIIGYASRLYGFSGLEATYDDDLSGARTLSPTLLLEARLLGTPVETVPATLHLTIDSRLQAAAQNALGERPGAVVLLDPQTGAILALATYPRFDPNQLILPDQASQEDVDRVQAAWEALASQPDSPLLNRATQGRYPPGSVIKTLTAAAALDSGVVAGPDGQVTCPNQLATEAGAPPVVNAVENLARRTGDPSDLRRVYAWSCNTAFAQLGLELGPARFGEYARRFGLGYADDPATPVLRDIPADSGSIAGSQSFLERPVALADTAFGQGQALVTPLDMAQMVAVIANGGNLMRPYLVAEVRAGDRTVYQAEPEVIERAISPQAAEQMRAIMQSSVEIGYAQPVALPGVTIGAKTGTAETPTGVPHSWFVAFAPVEQPQYAIAVIVEYGGEGSRTALPVAREVLAAALGVEP